VCYLRPRGKVPVVDIAAELQGGLYNTWVTVGKALYLPCCLGDLVDETKSAQILGREAEAWMLMQKFWRGGRQSASCWDQPSGRRLRPVSPHM